MTYHSKIRAIEIFFLALVLALVPSQLNAAGKARLHPDKAKVFDHWTPDRMRQAIPRDLRIDNQRRAFIRGANGHLVPYGAEVAAQVIQGKPSGGSNDTQEPDFISFTRNPDPADNGVSQEFLVEVRDDASGIRSVDFKLQFGNGPVQSFSGVNVAQDTWRAGLTGFSDGAWSWWVVAKDGAKKGGNTATSDTMVFTVDTSGSVTPPDDPVDPPATGDVVVNEPWSGGAVQMAAGRIYFEMPGNAKWKGPWSGYVCSGTVVADSNTGRSLILTAAHCVYDDVNGAFARNVMFIPNQAGSSNGTDQNCSNDPIGCWAPEFGVVDVEWTQYVFPDNIPWDYAFYVVKNTGAHSGNGSDEILDSAAGFLNISFETPNFNLDNSDLDYTHGLGYSYSDDPNFMYCAEDMTTEGNFNWWLASCGLSGGASGGPWMQYVNTSAVEDDVIMSVNSWGYTTSAGMAGPVLSDTSAACLYEKANTTSWSDVSTNNGLAGIAVVFDSNCPAP